MTIYWWNTYSWIIFPFLSFVRGGGTLKMGSVHPSVCTPLWLVSTIPAAQMIRCTSKWYSWYILGMPWMGWCILGMFWMGQWPWLIFYLLLKVKYVIGRFVNEIPAAQFMWSNSKRYSWCILGMSQTSSKVTDLDTIFYLLCKVK